MMSDIQSLNTPPDRPPILLFLCLFAALLGLALGLAALAPAPGASAEDLVRDVQRSRSEAAPAEGTQPPMAAQRAGSRLDP